MGILKSTKVLIGAFFCLEILSSGLYAQEIRFGTVDMQKVLQTVEAGKHAKSELEKAFHLKKNQLQEEENAIRKMNDEFSKQSLVMNEEARKKKQNDLQERIMKFQELTARSQMEIQQKEKDLTQPILNQIREIISKISQQKKYSIVLDRNENNVLYSQTQDDFTDEVILLFNQQFPSKK